MAAIDAYFVLDDFAFPTPSHAITPDPGDARVIQLCDAVVSAITDALDPSDTTTVARCYLPEIDPETLSGRHVRVFPLDYSQAGIATRGLDTNQYGVGILVVEKYTAQVDIAATTADAWTDVRVKWVQDYIFDLLGTARIDDMTAALLAEDTWPETGEVASVYDAEMLREHKLFWSESAFAFRRDE